MNGAVRLCRRVPGGRCLSYCGNLDKERDRCKLAPNPPKRWGRGVDVIELPMDEFERGERGGGESEVVEMTVGRPARYQPSYTHRPNMDGASIEQLESELARIYEQEM